MRDRLLPDVDDPAVADALFRTYELAIRQSATSSYGTRWWAMPPSVDAFVGRLRRPPSSAGGLITKEHGRTHPSIEWYAHHHAELGLTASRANHCRPSSSAVQRRMPMIAVAP